MKKLYKIVIVVMFVILFIPQAKAKATCESGAATHPSITIPGNSVYVYYEYNEDTGSTVSYSYNTSHFNKGNFQYLYKGTPKGYRDFIYTSTNLHNKTKDNPFELSGNLATIKLNHSAYYYDDGGDRVYLDITFDLTKLKLIPMTSSCNNSGYRYAIFSFNNKRVYSSSRLIDQVEVGSGKNKKKVWEEVHWKQCSANVVANYTVTFSTSNGTVPSNMVFLWKIIDLDQPDKSGSSGPSNSYSGTYVEALEFKSGFTGTFYRSSPTCLKRKKNDDGTYTNKFYATRESAPSDVDVGNLKTSVWAIQTGSTAKVKWVGSAGVETALIGENNYVPNICKIVNNKHYGSNGSEVDESTYKDQCACRVRDGKYYGSNATEVNATDYVTQCRCRHIGGGKYLDVNGKKTDRSGWAKSCACTQRNTDYYYGAAPASGDNIPIVTYWDYKAQCFDYEYTGDSCKANPSKNTVNDGDCNGGSVVDSYTKRKTSFGTLPLNSDSKEHTSCVSSDYEAVETAYIKEPTKHMDIVSGGNKITNGCAPVKISVPLTVTENITLKVSKLSGKKIKDDNYQKEYIYAGGGFGWGGSTVTNELNKIWAVSKKELNGSDTFDKAFKMQFKYYLGNSKPATDYYKLSEVPLYKNSNCTGVISYDELVNSVIANNKIAINNLSLNEKFQASTDVNNVEETDKSMAGVLSKSPDPETGGFSDKNNSVFLKTAYIDRRTAEVSYSNTVVSEDTTDINSEDNNLINAGRFYYVPLKYTADVFKIEMKNQNLSVIGQETSFSTTCKINVAHIFYEDNGKGRLKTAFHYRPIKIDDTFNGKSKEQIAENAQNWAEWYCDENGNCGNTTNRQRLERTYEEAGCTNSNAGYDANNPGTNADNNKKSCTNPLYHITIDSTNVSKIRKYNDSSYTSFDNVNNDGSSKFVSSMFEQNGRASNLSYCNLGQFNASCDGRSGS